MKRFLEDAKVGFLGLLAFPLGVAIYLVYVHVVSLLEPILAIVLGGGFFLAILVCVGWFFIHLKDFIVSIFLSDDELVKRGYRKKL